jgi:excisionase family DNA binding protein
MNKSEGQTNTGAINEQGEGTITTLMQYKEALHALTYSVRDGARILGIGRESCYTLIRAGELRVLRIGEMGGKIRIPRSELQAFIDRQLEKSPFGR